MDDLKERLGDWETVYPCDADKPEGHLYVEAKARIEALERQIAAADKLAKASQLAFHRLEMIEGAGNSGTSVNLRAALTAYQATKEQSDG